MDLPHGSPCPLCEQHAKGGSKNQLLGVAASRAYVRPTFPASQKHIFQSQHFSLHTPCVCVRRIKRWLAVRAELHPALPLAYLISTLVPL